MSTGKRLAKRSIIGTRVCAPGEDGIYHSGVILAIKTPPGVFPENNNSINLTPNTRYTVRFDGRGKGRTTAEFLEADLVGPGFNSVIRTQLVTGQKAFVTYNNREVSGEVQMHHQKTDVVVINLTLPGNKNAFQVEKRLEEVRLLESRKSARLADQDTDFARLADMAGDRKRTASHTIDVPTPATHHYGSRKRRPSSGQEDASPKDPQLDECSAALVLMSLSASPHSPHLSNMSWAGTSPGSSSSGSSCRLSPSPPPRETSSPITPFSSSSASDEGIVMDYGDELPRKKKSVRRTIYQCTWPKCSISTSDCESIEAHVRNEHLNTTSITDREEEFYYKEIEPSSAPSPISYLEMSQRQPPTLSHMDMARPPHEDPEYQRQFVRTFSQHLYSGPINIPQSPHKLPKLSPRPHSPKTPVSPRRARGENKKCRKKYGMEHKEQWCTQCKWKKACSRFGD